MEREQLIEDALWTVVEKMSLSLNGVEVQALSEAALAVFEGAYTPTDDEREVLAWSEFEDWNGATGHHSGADGEVAAESFFAGYKAAFHPTAGLAFAEAITTKEN